MVKGQIEDDTAQLTLTNPNILINTDIFVENVHFSDSTMSPQDIGWKTVAANISDLAGSGVDHIFGITVGIATPAKTSWSWLEKVYQGINDALNHFGGQLLGGDLSRSNQTVLSITAIGSVGKLRLHRSYAKNGDIIVTSGPHGLSRLGLALLTNNPNINSDNLSKSLKIQAIKAHQRPQTGLAALTTLKNCKPSLTPWRAAGTDSSDGLLNALQSICESSYCQAILDPNQLPKANSWPLGLPWEKWCMNGGEDFELILSLPSEWAQSFVATFPLSKIIGSIQKGDPKLMWTNGEEISLSTFSEFEHF